MLKQFQSNPPPAQVKAVEEICVTYGGAHLYYQCLAVGGNTFPEYRHNIQGYVSAATEKIKRMNDVSLKAMQNQIDMVKNELRNEMKTSIQTSLSNQTNEIECVEETYTDPDHAEYNIKVPPPPPVQKPKPQIQINFVIHTRDSLSPRILYPFRMLKQKQQEKDDVQIQKFWNMFKQLHLNITLAEALMTLELANRAICTPDGIARDVFVPVGKFTFPADFVIADYESDPRVPLILERPFLRTARALIDVHGEEMILRDGDE
nr:reverse transcriptase domain-containing protein [Tanacetum cinerariifolium]